MKVGKISVEFIDSKYANSSMQERINYVSSLATISRGKRESTNPEKTFNRLIMEAEGGLPSRPLEFCPVFLEYDSPCFQSLNPEQKRFIAKFGIDDNIGVATNLRAMLTVCNKHPEQIPFNNQIYNFFAVRVTAPMFVWAQIATHTQLSMESQSDRLVKEDTYWLPNDIIERFEFENYQVNEQQILSDFLTKQSMTEIQYILKNLGYKREIYSRFPYYNKMKSFILTGWNQYLTWGHFFFERQVFPDIVKGWTQAETAYTAKLIFDTIQENISYDLKEVLISQREYFLKTIAGKDII